MPLNKRQKNKGRRQRIAGQGSGLGKAGGEKKSEERTLILQVQLA